MIYSKLHIYCKASSEPRGWGFQNRGRTCSDGEQHQVSPLRLLRFAPVEMTVFVERRFTYYLLLKAYF
jgi:hypothetical protein